MVTYEIFFGALSSFLVVGVGAFLWILSEFRATRQEMQSLRQENREESHRTREENKEENQRTREEIRASTQRILEALYFHRHDTNTGEAIFYPPTPTTPAPQAD